MRRILCGLLLGAMLFSTVSCDFGDDAEETTTNNTTVLEEKNYTVATVPAYTGSAYVLINDNKPTFTSAELTTVSFVQYSDLDDLRRCGVAIGCIGQDLMPTESHSSSTSVKPTGWHTVKYDSVDGKYLYNRCQLIGYDLCGENASTKNIITGTKYMIVQGITPFETLIADYIEDSGNHVMFRVTPIFDGENLLARGVQLEGYSVEDSGKGVCFNVYCYNVQPGIEIDYATGESEGDGQSTTEEQETIDFSGYTYVLNTTTKKVHTTTCRYAITTDGTNKKGSNATASELLELGYSPCGTCKPFGETTEETTTEK